jgi:hypothetical protein
MPAAAWTDSRWRHPAAVFVLLLIVYNANGREIASYDTTPTGLAARELLLRGTLGLNHVVGRTPEYAQRWGVILARDGRYRSVYSPVSPALAAGLTWPFWRSGLIDIRAPLAPRLMAKLTASTMVALAVALGFVTIRKWLSAAGAWFLAVGWGLGTGLWSTASQTLWQTETAVLGFAIAVAALVADDVRSRAGIALGLGLALAGTARPQLAFAVGVLLVGAAFTKGRRFALPAFVIVGAAAATLAVLNWRWFGQPAGALPLLVETNAALHHTGAAFTLQPEGFAGLLISPNRGLLIYSPIVLVAALGIRPARAAGWRSPLTWCLTATVVQYLVYGSYAVWWGGHTYGPRYLTDLLPFLLPVAAAGLAAVQLRPVARAALASALSWSVLVAGTGAFVYPNDVWNLDPANVDRYHRRLWSVRDNQIFRCWERGPSPQNFSLFTRAAFGRDER